MRHLVMPDEVSDLQEATNLEILQERLGKKYVAGLLRQTPVEKWGALIIKLKKELDEYDRRKND